MRALIGRRETRRNNTEKEKWYCSHNLFEAVVEAGEPEFVSLCV